MGMQAFVLGLALLGATPNHTLMLSLADGKIPMSQLVDPSAGVVFIDHSGNPSGMPRRDHDGVRCGAELAALFDRFQKQLAHGLRATYQEARLTCSTSPYLVCTWRGSMEWDPTTYFVFRDDAARGLMLRAIVIEDELLVDPAVVARNRNEILPAIQRFESTQRCTS
jgi:hypothetical protein